MQSICLCLLLAAGAFATEPWWQNAVFYQVYPMSFFDKNNTGQGSLAGITENLSYLHDLGISGIWMNPIYPSPDADFGYDISNFTDIDPKFGNLNDLKTLINTAHNKGLKVLLDLVPNHSSIKHPWFQKSANGESPYKDYYVWQDKMPSGNWLSVMGGSAWQELNGKYYYHAFLKEQPDLNYRNKEVVNKMLDVMSFWLDMGIDGFRVDAVPYLYESTDVNQDEPLNKGCTDSSKWACLNHTLTANQNETFDLLAQFKSHIDDYSNKHGGFERIMITEATYPPSQLQRYFTFNGKDTATMPFNFELLSWNNDMTANDLKNVIDNVFNYLPSGHHTNWLLGNHDQRRISGKIGRPLVDAANMLNLLLPGTTFTYYGEEINMANTPISCSEIVDTAAKLAGSCAEQESITRDPERTPMQWNKNENAGFSEAKKTWLPVNPDYTEYNVQTELEDKRSHLNIYKDLVQLKYKLVNYTDFSAKNMSKWLYSFVRSQKGANDSYIVVINLNNEVETFNFNSFYTLEKHEEIKVMVTSRNSEKKNGDKLEGVKENISMRPYEGIVIYKYTSGASSLVASLLLPFFTLIMLLWRN